MMKWYGVHEVDGEDKMIFVPDGADLDLGDVPGAYEYYIEVRGEWVEVVKRFDDRGTMYFTVPEE